MNNVGNEIKMQSANNYVSAAQITRKGWKPVASLPTIMFAKVGAAIMLNRKRLIETPFLIDNNTMVYIFDRSWDSGFGRVLFETITLPRYAQVGALPSYNGSDIESITVNIPSSLSEQAKIGTFFRGLDELIALHQRKYEKLQKVKKSFLEKMFPAEGESKPRIRFKGYTDAWERRKLGEIAEITMGQSPNGNTYFDFPCGYILVQGNADLKDGWVCPRIWTTQKTKIADEGDLIMSVRAPAGAMGKTAYKVVLGRGVAGIKGNEFVFQLLSKLDAGGYWKKLSCGSTFESLNSNNINEASVNIPSSQSEQAKIGAFFRGLDELIALHQRKLNKLKNIKKSFLEKMFPSE